MPRGSRFRVSEIRRYSDNYYGVELEDVTDNSRTARGKIRDIYSGKKIKYSDYEKQMKKFKKKVASCK